MGGEVSTLTSGAIRLEGTAVPLASRSPLLRAATGALWGVAAAGLFTPRLRGVAAEVVPAGLALAGALLALARALPRDALSRPGLAAATAACGLVMARVPEPTFFVLVPLLAAGVAWPFGTAARPEDPLPRWTTAGLFLLAAAVFFTQAVRRHWSFASGGMDLGLFYQTQWLIAHGLRPENTLLGMHALGDHMLFAEFIVAPLLRLHDGAETLLLVQSVAVASAVFPLYAMGRQLLGRPRAALALPALWLLAPDVHSGILFDYNPTALGAAALLWAAWALACRGPWMAFASAMLVCGIKENFCLYLAAVALVMMAVGLVRRRRALAVAALATLIFVLEMAVLFPRFREGGFRHWEFADLGEGPREIAATLVTRPDRAAAVMVDDPRKRRSLLQPLAGSGYLSLADPVSLVMQLPNACERLLSSRHTRWWGYYYGMPALATALVGLVIGWKRLQEAHRAGPGLPAYTVTCALLVGLVPPYRTHDGDRRSMLYTLSRPYASAPADVATQRAAVAFIGHDPRLKVAAQHHLIPHLAGRPFIVGLDRAGEADVVALQLNGGTWPQGRPGWRRHVRALWASGRFHVAFCRGETVVLGRGPGDGAACAAFERLVSSPPPSSPPSTPEERP
jgi:uncharacterized membrane protein